MPTILLHQHILESIGKLNRSDILLTSTKIAPRNTCPDVLNSRNLSFFRRNSSITLFFFNFQWMDNFFIEHNTYHWTVSADSVLIYFSKLENSLEIKWLQMKLKTLFWICLILKFWFEFLFAIHAYRMILCFIFHSYILIWFDFKFVLRFASWTMERKKKLF